MLPQRPFNERGFRAQVRSRISCACTARAVSWEPWPLSHCSPQLRPGRRGSQSRPAPESYDARQHDIAATALQLSVQKSKVLGSGAHFALCNF